MISVLGGLKAINVGCFVVDGANTGKGIMEVCRGGCMSGVYMCTSLSLYVSMAICLSV